MEHFVDRTEITFESPSRRKLKKSDGKLIDRNENIESLRPTVANGNEVSVSMVTNSTHYGLSESEIENVVLSTTSIHSENKVVRGTVSEFQDSSAAFDDQASTPVVSPIKKPKDEPVRSFYTPGFSIREWACEDIKVNPKMSVSETFTRESSSANHKSVTSTITLNRNREFDLEKESSHKTEVSSLSFNVNKTPKKQNQTNTVEVTLNRPVEYDLERNTYKKNEKSEANIVIGNGNRGNISTENQTHDLKSDVKTESIMSSTNKDLNSSPLVETDSRSLTSEIRTQELAKSESQSLVRSEQVSTNMSQVSEVKSPPVVPSTPVDIQRKYFPCPDSEAVLMKAGAKEIYSTNFIDIYYDTENYDLSLANCFLLKRNSKFILKLAEQSENPLTPLTYSEVTKESDIVQFLVRKFQLDTAGKENIASCMKRIGFEEFLKMETKKKKYEYKDYTLVVDGTWNGVEIGEICLASVPSTSVSAALNSLDDVAKSLGWSLQQIVY